MPNLGFFGSPHASTQEMADIPDWVISMTLNCVRREQMLWDPHAALVDCSHLLVSLETYVQSVIVHYNKRNIKVEAKYLGEMPTRAPTCVYFGCL